jgi:hypothetical protein
MSMRRQISVSLVWNYGTLAPQREEEAAFWGKVFGYCEHFVKLHRMPVVVAKWTA